MKELDHLKEKCIQAMKDVDAYIDEHYDELCEEIRAQHNVPQDWDLKIVSNCGVVTGVFRHSPIHEWQRVIYNEGIWIENNLK